MLLCTLPLLALTLTPTLRSSCRPLRPSHDTSRRAAPDMGVPGFVTWLEATAPEALVTIQYGAPPRAADVVAFDMNSLLHTALRSSQNEDRALISVFQKLHAAIRQVEPETHVLLAVDGAAPLAKLATQRKRRGSASQRKHKGVPGLCATPGTRFMARLEQALIYWCCQELSAYRARHLTFELSGSDVPGEGEVKILEWLLDRNCATRCSTRPHPHPKPKPKPNPSPNPNRSPNPNPNPNPDPNPKPNPNPNPNRIPNPTARPAAASRWSAATATWCCRRGRGP